MKVSRDFHNSKLVYSKDFKCFKSKDMGERERNRERKIEQVCVEEFMHRKYRNLHAKFELSSFYNS